MGVLIMLCILNLIEFLLIELLTEHCLRCGLKCCRTYVSHERICMSNIAIVACRQALGVISIRD